MQFGPITRTPPARAMSSTCVLLAAAFAAGLGESVAVNRGDRDAFGHALFDRCRDGVGGHHDERVIDRFTHRCDIGIGFLAEDFVAAGIDRNDAAGVAVLAQVALRARGVLARVAGGADQRDERGSNSAWKSFACGGLLRHEKSKIEPSKDAMRTQRQQEVHPDAEPFGDPLFPLVPFVICFPCVPSVSFALNFTAFRRALGERPLEHALGDAVLQNFDRAAGDHPAAALAEAPFDQRVSSV